MKYNGSVWESHEGEYITFSQIITQIISLPLCILVQRTAIKHLIHLTSHFTRLVKFTSYISGIYETQRVSCDGSSWKMQESPRQVVCGGAARDET